MPYERILSSKKKRELKLAFKLYDKERRERLNGAQMIRLLRDIGVALDDSTVCEIHQADEAWNGFSIQDFLLIGCAFHDDQEIEKSIREGWDASFGEAEVKVDRLRERLLDLGTCLRLREDELLAFLETSEAVSDGKVHVDRFVFSLTARRAKK